MTSHNPTGVTLTGEQAKSRRALALALFEGGASMAELQAHPDLQNVINGTPLAIGSLESLLTRARRDRNPAPAYYPRPKPSRKPTPQVPKTVKPKAPKPKAPKLKAPKPVVEPVTPDISEEMPTAWGAYMKWVRVRLGLSIKELMSMMGYRSTQALVFAEQQRSVPSSRFVREWLLAVKLDVPAVDIPYRRHSALGPQKLQGPTTVGVRDRAKQVAMRVLGNPQLTDDQLRTLAETLVTLETRMLLHE